MLCEMFRHAKCSSKTNDTDVNSAEQSEAGDVKNSDSVQNSKQGSSGDSAQSEESWGYDLYPERKGRYRPSLGSVLFEAKGTEPYDKVRCERHVYSCIKNSPLVKLMLGALKSSGCPVDIRRHISCEVCDVSVTGGYDPELNQIVVCQNVATKEGIVQGILAHEMIHMFDYCRNKLDFKNLDHLACTEIRAANLTHCSFLSAFYQGDASPFNIKQRHQECVKKKAAYSIVAVRNVTADEAIAAVQRVFPKCYADLEPVGRRIRRKSYDMHRAYMEGPKYGYEL